jgi:hypothetical protein
MAVLLAGIAYGAALVAATATVGVAAYRDQHRQPEPTMWLVQR